MYNVTVVPAEVERTLAAGAVCYAELSGVLRMNGYPLAAERLGDVVTTILQTADRFRAESEGREAQ